MKKILLFVVVSMISLISFAQNPVSFGPKIGWNTNKLTTDYHQYVQDCKNGYQAGFFLSARIKRFYIQPEVYFSVKHGAMQTTITDPSNPTGSLSVSEDFNLQSIDVPLLLGFKVFDLKLLKLRVWGGPAASFVLDKTYTLSNTSSGTDLSDRITRDDFRDANWSVQFGAGLDLFMLTFDVGYEYGLNSFMSINSLEDLSFRNNLFFCSIGWRLF